MLTKMMAGALGAGLVALPGVAVAYLLAAVLVGRWAYRRTAHPESRAVVGLSVGAAAFGLLVDLHPLLVAWGRLGVRVAVEVVVRGF